MKKNIEIELISNVPNLNDSIRMVTNSYRPLTLAICTKLDLCSLRGIYPERIGDFNIICICKKLFIYSTNLISSYSHDRYGKLVFLV